MVGEKLGAQNQQGSIDQTWTEWGAQKAKDVFDATAAELEKLTGKFIEPEEASRNTIYQSDYNFRYMTFPNDLGMDYYGHYMIININVPTKGFSLAGNVGTEYATQFSEAFTPLATAELSTVDRLRFRGGAANSVTQGSRPYFTIPRQTRRIKDSIALFMPQGLNFDSGNQYEPITLAETAAGILGGSYGRAAYNSSTVQAGFQLGRNPINPGIEVVYVTTPLRTFTFIFLFAPKNEQESKNMETIIKTLRFHSAPEINNSPTGLGIGMTWIPPAEFDIQFFNKGVENTHLPRLNTCVLDRVSLDYNPISGSYSTFSNGHPVAVKLELQFTELEPIHKERVLAGFY